MSDQARSRANAHRNTARTAAVRRLLSGKPKRARDAREVLCRQMMRAEARLLQEVWQEVTVLSPAQIAAQYPDGYAMPRIWPIFTPMVRHL